MGMYALSAWLQKKSLLCFGRVRRLVWVTAVLLALAAFLFLFWKALQRYQESPVIVALDKQQRAVWEIPFPAVTVCPETKMYATRFNFTDVLLRSFNRTDEENDLFQVLALQCDDVGYGGPESRNSSVIDRIEEYALDLDDTIVGATFGRAEELVSFESLMTEEGLCFSFNMLPGKTLFPKNTFHESRKYLDYKNVKVQWSDVNGYHPNADLHAYPYRGVGAGKDAGFQFTAIVSDDNLDYLCKQGVQGFKVQLHGVADFPRPDQLSFLVPLDSVVRVMVTPYEVVTDPSMRESYTIEQRQCYFPGERPLRFFLHYTQSNCWLECIANFTLDHCGCVPYFMPRDNKTLICSGSKTHCGETAAWQLQQLETGLLKSSNHSSCQCLQSCIYVEYNSQRSLTPLDTLKWYQITQESVPQDFSRGAIIYIYFKDSHYIPNRRTELYTLFDMIANCGGLLGLFLGMSLLSIFELVYWLLLRPCWQPRTAQVLPRPPRVVKVNPSLFQFYYMQ